MRPRRAEEEQTPVAVPEMYAIARAVIRHEPGIGKERLGKWLGCCPNSAGRLLARYEGETKGHSNDPAYQQLLRIIKLHKNWNSHRVLSELVRTARIDLDRAKRLMAWYRGATEPAPELPKGFDWKKQLGPEPAQVSGTELYERVKTILAKNPSIGMEKLGREAGCRTSVARRIREQWRGEKEGHSKDPEYQRLLDYMAERQAQGQKNGLGAATLAAKLGITKTKAGVWLARYRGATQSCTTNSRLEQQAPAGKESGASVWDTTDAQLRVIGCQGAEIRSAEELLRREEVDQSLWQVTRTTTRRRESPPGYAEIQITLRRRTEHDAFVSLHKTLLLEFEKAGASKPTIPYANPGSDILFVPSLPDLHLGKYAWAAETGAAYDIDIAKQKVIDAIEDLLSKAALYKPARVLLPIGNDFFNTDSLNETTTAGTPQVEIGRWQETFSAGKALIVAAIERCRQLAPVHVIVVPGNHDTQRAFYLGDTIASYYRQTAGVSVDNTPTPRKYWQWGRVLLGMTHGDENRHERLPIIMAQERPKAWAETCYREWLLGHFHTRKRKFVAADEDQSGVLVRLMPSLTAADYWHAKKGFWSRRGAEGYLYHQKQGLIVELTHSIHQEQDCEQ